MQISPLRPSGSATDRSAPGAGVGVARAASRPVALLPPPADGAGAVAASAHAGLRRFDPQLNQQVAVAQQALNFLDQVGAQLQTLKHSFSGRLADSESALDDEPLEHQLKRFADLMRRRAVATSQSLDGRLALQAPGEARQTFRIRGLDVKALVGGDRETLAIAIGGEAPVSVQIDPELAPRAMINRLDQALMPAGVRVRRDAQGELAFSVAESAWPDVRDAIAIRGAGQRFPTGQFNRIALDPEPEAIRPQSWQADDAAALRRTLQEIVVAVELVRRARAQVAEALHDASRRFDAAGEPGESLWSVAFVDQFKALGERPQFELFSAIAPALVAISRHRVTALLSVR